MYTLNILIVEEHPADVRRLREHLHEQGEFTLTVAQLACVDDALYYLEEVEIDALILGLPLREPEPHAALHRLIDQAPDVPIVVHANLAQHRLVFDTMKHGAYDYLLKDRPDPDHLHHVLVNIAERRWKRQGPYARELRLRRLVENASEGMVVFDHAGDILFSNRTAQELLHWGRQDLLSHNTGRSLLDLDSKRLEIPRPDGTQTFVEVTISTIDWCNEPAYLASFHDVTQRHELENKLAVAKAKGEEISRLKSMFFNNLSYELREPLTTILGFADTLMQEATDEKHREFAAIIKHDGQGLFDTLNAILQLSQLDEGGLDVAYRMVPCAKAAQEVIAKIEPRACRKNVPIRFQSLIQSAFIKVDLLLFQRVILNILEYLLDTLEASEIVVEVTADPEDVNICLLGANVDLPYLGASQTDAFAFPKERELSQQQNALSLDLEICNRLVTLMDGRIDIDHSPMSRTTAFSVRFPRLAPGLRETLTTSWLPEPEPVGVGLRAS
jgi:signal transduction histidine kinase